jgi:positive regulator of sigma E activity
MKDKGKIISLKGSFAQVELNCVSGCQKCVARHLCSNKEQEKGFIHVLNPIKANPGDEVTIEVPEGRYSKTLTVLFSFMLMASLLGMLLGVICAGWLSLPSYSGGIIGFFLGLAITGSALFYHFRKNKKGFYPEIIGIIREGDYHE